MPTNAFADLQFDFFLSDSLSDNLWMASGVHAFSVEADRVLPMDPESSFDVDSRLMDSWQPPTTDGVPIPRQPNTTGRSEILEMMSTSRDEHLPPSSAAELDSLSTDDRWGSDEVRDNYGLQVNQPAEHAAYHDGIISSDTRYDNQSHHQRRQTGGYLSSTWSETDDIANEPRSSSSSASTSRTTERSTWSTGSGRPRQINPPLTMHYADYVRQISSVSRQITTSTPPSPTTKTTTTSVRRGTGGGSRSGVAKPSSRPTYLGGRRTSTSNSSSECGRRCPRFRPGVRRQFCDAQFGESRILFVVKDKFSGFVRIYIKTVSSIHPNSYRHSDF